MNVLCRYCVSVKRTAAVGWWGTPLALGKWQQTNSPSLGGYSPLALVAAVREMQRPAAVTCRTDVGLLALKCVLNTNGYWALRLLVWCCYQRWFLWSNHLLDSWFDILPTYCWSVTDAESVNIACWLPSVHTWMFLLAKSFVVQLKLYCQALKFWMEALEVLTEKPFRVAC